MKTELINCNHCSAEVSSKAILCPYCEKEQVANLPIFQGYNKYGVSRNIPKPIRKIVRERCGFGCVICGRAICEYDHFDPPFSELRFEHDPAGISLLCLKHHGQKTKRIIGDDLVLQASNDPAARKNGFAFEEDFLQPNSPRTILLGANGSKGSINDCDVVLSANGEPMIWFDNSETKQIGFLNAKFFDRDGFMIAEIEQNVLTIKPSFEFDILTPNAELIISLGGRKILHLDRQESKVLTIISADLTYGCNHFYVGDDKIVLNSNTFWKKLTMNRCPNGVGLICSCNACKFTV